MVHKWLANPMKTKRKRTFSTVLLKSSSSSSQQTFTSYYLPDECWESILRFIIDDDENHNRRYLNSLSLVSKKFLSITNRLLFSLFLSITNHLLFSLTLYNKSPCRRLFNRFTNINSLKLRGNNIDKLLFQISRLPLKLTSLNISYIPANVLRTFSKKITTLTSLTCCKINISDLFLIAKCFPLLKELDLSYSLDWEESNISYLDDGIEALSLALIKLRKVNLSGFPINNQSLFHLFNNCKYLEEVIIFKCHEITSAGLASAICERPTLRSLSFSTMEDGDVFPSFEDDDVFPNLEDGDVFSTSQFIDSLVILKGLTCLVLHNLNISDELLYSIAREGLPLTRLDLYFCKDCSYAGIYCLLSKCQRIQHLNLQYANFLEDQHVFQLCSFLADLVSINLSHCKELTYSSLFTLVRNCPALSEIKMVSIQSNSTENFDSLVEFGVYPKLKSLYLGQSSWLSDKSIIMFASIFPNLQLLDLNSCNSISKGICEVLRKCCKIRHLNLADCSRVTRLGINFLVPNLEVLNLSNTKVDDKTLHLISKNCSGLSQLLLTHCKGVTKKAVKRVLENRTQLKVVMDGGVQT